jgi:FlaA1/EpsC-like NDP-sugar epimerase
MRRRTKERGGAVATTSSAPPERGVPERLVGWIRRDVPLAVLDLAAVFACYFVPLVLRFGGEVPERYWRGFWFFGSLAVVVHLLFNYLLGLYGQIWRYASVQEARRVLLAGVLSLSLIVPADLVPRVHPLPLSVVVLGGVLTIGAFGVIRFQARLFGFRRREAEEEPRRVLVMGAGDAGVQVVGDVIAHPSAGIDPVGLIDDDARKVGRSVHGVKILGGRSTIPGLVPALGVDEILLAIPSATSETVRDVSALCEESGVRLLVLPSVRDVVGGRVSARDIRDVRIEDLLGREQVETDIVSVGSMLRGRRVLVTGAGGSIGSEIARQVAALEPATLVLLDHDETLLHEVRLDLGRHPNVISMLADIRDRDRILAAVGDSRPQVIFHAAAHKHVPVLEEYPAEAVLTNILGTANVADAALAWDAERFVMISTDKAVNTTNVMGASKWFAEQIVRSLDGGPCTFCSVRFGNVLGSRGSVIPTFLRQIERGGPVTVTDGSMARYFMSVGEAVQLVLQAGALSTGGEVFTLEMGQPVNILDLAKRLIRLSGRVPGADVQIVLTGARPGEKMVEEIVDPSEELLPSSHPDIRISRAPRPRPSELRSAIRELEGLAVAGDGSSLSRRLKELSARPSEAREASADSVGIPVAGRSS